MTELTVTGTAEVDGRVVTGTATAQVTRAPRITVEARHLIAFAELLERHAAEFRRDLDRLLAREYREG